MFVGVLAGAWNAALAELVKSVDAVGMTVSDMDRSVEFFSKVLSFEKVSDLEVAGSEYERLQGVFGARMKIVRMRLGDEIIELTEYLRPRAGRFQSTRAAMINGSNISQSS